MRMSVKLFLGAAVAVLLVWALIAPEPATGQESQGTGDRAGSNGDAGAGVTATSAGTAAEAGEDANQPGGSRAQVPLQPGSTLPPKNLKKVGDHWTPYDPPDPESFPKDATLHIIVPGDTLWDLADLAFGNPYLWPQIWNENRYILDSHWIYPGDPLLLPARPTVVSEVVPQGQEGAPPVELAVPPPAPAADETQEQDEAPEEALTAEAPEEEPAAPARQTSAPMPDAGAHAPRSVPKIEPLADEHDIRCSGYIARHDNKADYFIASQEEESKISLTEGDIIYMNRGQENGHVEPGTEYSIVVRIGAVEHPVTHKRLGIYYKRLGTVKVLAYQEYTAVGEITVACDDIRAGYDLVPLTVTPLPAKPAPAFSRIAPIDPDKPSGYIVHMEDNVARAGTGTTVDIDLGFDDGLKAGDFLMVFVQPEPRVSYKPLKADYMWGNTHLYAPETHVDYKNALPQKVIGQGVVLMTEKHTATVKIIQSVREIEIGDSVVVQ